MQNTIQTNLLSSSWSGLKYIVVVSPYSVFIDLVDIILIESFNVEHKLFVYHFIINIITIILCTWFRGKKISNRMKTNIFFN